MTRSLLVGAVLVLSLAPVAGAPDDEFVRVAEDYWSFVTSESGTRFIPFGTNFLLNEKRFLNLFCPEVYDAERYERALIALEQLGFNVVKVFLPIAQVLPDPQTPGEVHIAPGYLDNLEHFLGLAHKHHFRAVVSLASWGGNTVKWWHEGGQYFGRKPWRTDDGIDSLDVLVRFWTAVGDRFRDNPTIFAYTPAVEWSFPAGNLTWTPPDKQYGRLESEQGLFYWRAFLRARYDGEVAKLNAAYGTEYASFDQVPIVDYTYDAKARKYADPDAKILDYQAFREWSSMRYLRPQIEAIRRADPNHMVTISNHGRQPIGLWEGAARYFMGFSVPEQSDLVDYLTTHENHAQSELKPGQSIDTVVRGAVLRVRFCNAARMLPLVIEEMTFGSPDPQQVADAQEKLTLGTVGHAAGWMNWYLQFPSDANEADLQGTDRSAILDDNFAPTPWGLRAQDLIWRLAQMDLSRQGARTVFDVDRTKCLVPREWGPELVIVRDWDKYEHPIDFRWPCNEWINLKLVEER